MAINFKNTTKKDIGTGFTEIYLCPGSIKSAVVFGLTLANTISPAQEITVEGRIMDLSKSEYSHFIAPGTPITVGSTLVPVGGIQKIVLEPGDKIEVSSSDNNSVDAVVSVLEIS